MVSCAETCSGPWPLGRLRDTRTQAKFPVTSLLTTSRLRATPEPCRLLTFISQGSPKVLDSRCAKISPCSRSLTCKPPLTFYCALCIRICVHCIGGDCSLNGWTRASIHLASLDTRAMKLWPAQAPLWAGCTSNYPWFQSGLIQPALKPRLLQLCRYQS